MVFTIAELDRRTRERSKQAALKIAAQRAKDHEAREAAAKRKITARDLANQIQRENAAKFRRDRSAGVGHSQGEDQGVSRTGDPRRVRSPPSSARVTKTRTTRTGSGRRCVLRLQRDSSAKAEASRLEHSRVSTSEDARKMLSPTSRVQAAARTVTEIGSGMRHGIESWRNNTTGGVEASQPRCSRLSTSGDAREIHSPSCKGQTAAGSGRGHAAGSLRGSAAGFEASQHVRSRVSASRYPPRMRSPSSETRNANRNITATESGRRNVAKRQRDNAAEVEPSQRWRSRVSEAGEPSRMCSSSSIAQTASRSMAAAGSGGGHVAGDLGNCDARVEASHLGFSQVSAGGDPQILSSSSMGRTTAGGADATGPGKKKVAESRGRQKRAATRPARKSQEKRRHETTTAFMARQRRQAALDKRRKEAEEQRKAELVRLALKELEQNRKRAISQRPHRSRSRRNRRASSHLAENAPEVRRSTERGVPREGRGSRRVRASHAARGPEPPQVNTEPVEPNHHGEGGDSRRERGGGEAARVKRNTSLEDKLPFIMEILERTTLTVLDLQRRCARLSEVIDGPRGAPRRRRPQPHEENQVARVPSPEVHVGTEEMHRPPSWTSNVETTHWQDQVSSRPATSLPKPVALQMRRSDPILQPPIPPPPGTRPLPSSVVSVGLPPMGAGIRNSQTTNNVAASSEMDGPSGVPLPRPPQPLKEKHVAFSPPEVPLGTLKTCRPPSTPNVLASRQQDQVSSRPVISQTQPTELQTRSPDPILQPLTSPHPAAQPCPFPTVFVESAPVNEATLRSPTTNDATTFRVSAKANNGTPQSRSTISSHETTEVLPALSCPRFVTVTSGVDVSRQTMPYVSEEQSVVPTPTPQPDHGEAHAEVEAKAQADETAPGTLACTTRYSLPTAAVENADGIDRAIEDEVLSASVSVEDARAEDEDTSSKTIKGELLGMSTSSDEGYDKTAGGVEPVSLRSWETDPEVPEEQRLGLDVDELVQGDMPYVSEKQSVVPTPTPHLDRGGAHAEVETKTQCDETTPGTLALTTRYYRPTVAAESADDIDHAIEDVVLSTSTPVVDTRAEDDDRSSKTIGSELLGMSASSGVGCDKTAGVVEPVSSGSWEIDSEIPEEDMLGLDVDGLVQGDRPYVSEEQSVVPTPTPQPDLGGAHAEVETEAQGDGTAPGTLAFTSRYSRPTVAAENMNGPDRAIEDVVLSFSAPVEDTWAKDENASSKMFGSELLGMSASSGEGCDETAGGVESMSSRSWEIDPEVPEEDRLGLDVDGLVQGDMPYVSGEQSIVPTPTPQPDHGGAHADIETEAQGDEAAPGTLAFTTRYSRLTMAAENGDDIDQAIEDIVFSTSTPVADASTEAEATSSKTIGSEFLGMSASSGVGCDKPDGVVEPVSLSSREIGPEVPEEERLGLDVGGLVQSDASLDHDKNAVESLGTPISEVLSLSSSSPEEDSQNISGKVGAISSQFWTDSAEAPEGKNEDIYDFEPVQISRLKTPWITAAAQASEGKTEHAASSISFTSTASEASLGVRTGGGCQGKDDVYDFELMPLTRPRTLWMAVATQASEGKTEHVASSASFTSTADAANFGVRTGGGCQGKDDIHDFEPTKLARPRTPWMTAAAQASEGKTKQAAPFVSFTSTADEASLGVRTGGECQDDIYDFEPMKLAQPRTPWIAASPQASEGKTEHAAPSVSFTSTTGGVSLGVRTGGGCQGKTEWGSGQLGRGDKRGGGLEPEQLNEEEEKDSSQEVGVRPGQDEEQQQEDSLRTTKENTDWPKYPWGPLLADTITTALNSMTLEELNDRMEILSYPVEPFLEELEGEDTMEFPPPPEAPVEEDAVIPPHVLDALLELPEEEANASLAKNEGHPTPDREAVCTARWMAIEAANEYLAKRREARNPRRLCAPPPPNGKILQHFEGFRCFRSVEEAIQEVTEAVLGEDSLYQSGRWRTSKWVQTLPLPTTKEDENLYEEDEYFLKCKVAEDILHELLDDTVQECKRVYDR